MYLGLVMCDNGCHESQGFETQQQHTLLFNREEFNYRSFNMSPIMLQAPLININPGQEWEQGDKVIIMVGLC